MMKPKAKCMVCNYDLQKIKKSDLGYTGDEVAKDYFTKKDTDWYCCPVNDDPHFFARIKNKNTSYGGSIYTKKYIICSLGDYWSKNSYGYKLAIFKKPDFTNFKIWAGDYFYFRERIMDLPDLIDFKNADDYIDNLRILT